MLYVEILLIAISLSMDAFSLSISLSTLNIKNKNKYVFFVGLFHFFMPILGLYLKLIFDKVYKVPSNALFIAVIVFIIIGIIIK